MSFIPGANVGPYRIVEQAERRGAATAYTAYQPALGRYVTVVVVPAIDRDDVALQRQYQRQIELVLSLRHPNILTVLDSGEHLGVPYVVTEQVAAEPLRERLGAPWPLAEVVRVVRPLADALDAAHALGVVHGDVQSSAVLLTSDGTPLLAGFGLMTRPIAALAGAPASGPLPDLGVGAAASLEEIAAAQAADRRGLALIAYELLTGRAVDLDAAELERPLPRSQIGSPLLSPSVEQVLLRELSGPAWERYPTAAAFAADLAAAQETAGADGAITMLTPASTAAPPADGRSRRRLLTVAAIFVALAALGTLALLLRGGEAARPIASPAKPTETEAALAATAGPSAPPAPSTAVASQAGDASPRPDATVIASGPFGAGSPAPRQAVPPAPAKPEAARTPTRAAPSISLVVPSPDTAAGPRATPGSGQALPGGPIVIVPRPVGTTATGPGSTVTATATPTAARTATPTAPAAGSTRLPVTWRVAGDPSGRWMQDDEGRVVGRTETGASVLLFPETVEDVSFAATVSTTSCQATLVFRAQDDENLLMAIYIPDGLPTPGTAGGGVWLYQRVEGLDLPIRAVRPATVRPAGEPVRLKVVTSGPQITIFLNDAPALQAVDTAARAGRLGLMVYSTSGRLCEATFGDIERGAP